MPSVSRTFTVTAAPKQVLDYLKDFANAEEWDPGTQTCTRIDDGPVTIGSSWHNVSKIVGVTAELKYVLRELTESRLVFEGTNKSATSTDTIVVTPAQGGAQLDYRADLEMHGPAKLMSPAMKLVFEKLAGETETQMTKVLNSLSG
ncbi:SRPBCC family protein [Mycolicibacterium komossense]|uniref:SRPBCC family protein n=1 Tax=Mycolicibacterium komossense TaxID=1779 RepID=A0ABT3CA22_9MYCO|nr:SRPBCC family protein [Mycolicibacterium komossense]MCV7226330.1 SRPBCC family protein [Mycolicibacterium komossense]